MKGLLSSFPHTKMMCHVKECLHWSQAWCLLWLLKHFIKNISLQVSLAKGLGLFKVKCWTFLGSVIAITVFHRKKCCQEWVILGMGCRQYSKYASWYFGNCAFHLSLISMCEFFAAFWYFLVFIIVFLYYRSERSCCHMESWSSQELYSPAMHYSKHLEAASPHGPRRKVTFVAALLGFLASFSKSDGVGTLLWRILGQMVWGVTADGNSCANSDAAASPVTFSLGDRIILCIFSLCAAQIW